MLREIGVVVAGDKSRPRDMRREKVRHGGAAGRSVGRGRAGPRVERVPVQHQVCHTVEERAELIESADLTGTVAEMDVGKDADEFGRHVGKAFD